MIMNGFLWFSKENTLIILFSKDFVWQGYRKDNYHLNPTNDILVLCAFCPQILVKSIASQRILPTSPKRDL